MVRGQVERVRRRNPNAGCPQEHAPLNIQIRCHSDKRRRGHSVTTNWQQSNVTISFTDQRRLLMPLMTVKMKDGGPGQTCDLRCFH